jgi:hypothetical protein
VLGVQVLPAVTGKDRAVHSRVQLAQSRDKHLLLALDTLRVIDREQAKLVAGFNSTTRANTRLLKLKQAGFLRRFFIGTPEGGVKAIYALSPRGAILVGVPTITAGVRRGTQPHTAKPLLG